MIGSHETTARNATSTFISIRNNATNCVEQYSTMCPSGCYTAKKPPLHSHINPSHFLSVAILSGTGISFTILSLSQSFVYATLSVCMQISNWWLRPSFRIPLQQTCVLSNSSPTPDQAIAISLSPFIHAHPERPGSCPLTLLKLPTLTSKPCVHFFWSLVSCLICSLCHVAT